jgi:hypothetical protein
VPDVFLDSSVLIGLVFRHAGERAACQAALPPSEKLYCSRPLSRTPVGLRHCHLKPKALWAADQYPAQVAGGFSACEDHPAPLRPIGAARPLGMKREAGSAGADQIARGVAFAEPERRGDPSRRFQLGSSKRGNWH